MNFIDKQKITLLQIVQNCSHFAGLFDRRTAGYLHVDAHFVGDNPRKRRLSKTGRSVKQNVIQRIMALLCRFDINF